MASFLSLLSLDQLIGFNTFYFVLFGMTESYRDGCSGVVYMMMIFHIIALT